MVAHIDLDNPSRVTIALSAAFVSAAISVRTPSCSDANDEMGCVFFDEFNNDDALRYEDIDLPAGRSYVVIEGNFAGEALLSVEVQ